jgi:hypothetical protein
MEVRVQTPDGKEVTVDSLEQLVGLMAAQNTGTFIVHTTADGFLIVLGAGAPSVGTSTAITAKKG